MFIKPSTYNKKELAKAISSSFSFKEAARKLCLRDSGYLKKKAVLWEIDFSHFTYGKGNYCYFEVATDDLRNAISSSNNFRQVALKLGLKSGHSLEEQAKNKGIDFSHFTFGKAYRHIIGKKFGMLIVSDVYQACDKKGRTWAKCKCDCGGIKEIRCDELVGGRRISCGCHSKNRWNMVAFQNPAFKGYGEICSGYYKEIKRSAIRRKIEFNISVSKLWDLFIEQDRKCALTGISIQFGRLNHRHETTASLDRIDNKKGHISGNLQWVLKDINMLRADYNIEYFIRLCNIVAINHPRSNEELYAK